MTSQKNIGLQSFEKRHVVFFKKNNFQKGIDFWYVSVIKIHLINLYCAIDENPLDRIYNFTALLM